MKNIFKYLAFLLPLLALTSCEEESKTIVTAEGGPVVLELDEANLKLDPNYKDNTALTLIWSQADYGQQVIANYDIYLDDDKEFASPYVVEGIRERAYSFTVSKINEFAQNAGVAPGAEGTLYIKVVSYLGANHQLTQASNVISVQLSPYTTYSFKDYYLVGDATAPGWSNSNNNPPLFRDSNNENLYHYTGSFGDGNIKILKSLGNWRPQYGKKGADGKLVMNQGDDEPDPIPVPGAGFYTFTVNFEEMTYSLDSYDASGATIYPTIGIIGSATPNGWDSDIDMKALDSDKHIWYMNGVELENGELKFRANDAWDISWGADTPYSGKGVLGGPNIPVTKGNYDIWFNDLTGDYMLIPNE